MVVRVVRAVFAAGPVPTVLLELLALVRRQDVEDLSMGSGVQQRRVRYRLAECIAQRLRLCIVEVRARDQLVKSAMGLTNRLAELVRLRCLSVHDREDLVLLRFAEPQVPQHRRDVVTFAEHFPAMEHACVRGAVLHHAAGHPVLVIRPASHVFAFGRGRVRQRGKWARESEARDEDQLLHSRKDVHECVPVRECAS